MLRAFPTGNRTFAFRFRGPNGKIQGAVIGRYPDLKLAAARLEAAELRKRVRSGDDVTAAATKAANATADEIQASIPRLD